MMIKLLHNIGDLENKESNRRMSEVLRKQTMARESRHWSRWLRASDLPKEDTNVIYYYDDGVHLAKKLSLT